MTAALVCPGSASAPDWRSPAARKVLAATAPRSAWLEARRSGIGSSDASAVLGVNGYTSPYEVWAEKRGLLPLRDDDNDAMEWGRLHEPTVARWWSARYGIPIRRAGLMRSRSAPHRLASVDYLAGCGGVLEIKTLSWRVASSWADGQTPDHAEVQVAHQLAVTGRSHAHVVGLLDGRTPLVRELPRDDELIALMEPVEDDLWRMVVEGIEPPIDGSGPTTDALKERWPALEVKQAVLGDELEALVAAHRAAKAEFDAAEAAASLAGNRLRALLADATEAFVEEPDGKAKPLVTWRRNGTFSESRLRAFHPDLAAELTVPVTVPALDVARLKREHPAIYAECRSRTLRVAAPPKERKSDG